jgi:hypothetical protein
MSLSGPPVTPHDSSAAPRVADRVIRAGAIYSMTDERRIYKAGSAA